MQSNKEITFKRASLYEEVWAEPVSIVSKRYGLSDNGLRKVCKKLSVPMPPLGYWAKLRAGQKVRRPTLKRHEGSDTATAEPTHRTHRTPEPAERQAAERNIRDDERYGEGHFVVDTSATYKNRLVREVAKRLAIIDKERDRPDTVDALKEPWRKPKLVPVNKDRYKSLISPGTGFLSIAVTRETRLRALAISDLFFSALEGHGFSITADDGKTMIRQLDIEAIFRISEITERIPGAGIYGTSIERPLGSLRITLEPTSPVHAGIPRRITLRDEPGKPLEQKLSRVVSTFRISLLGHTDRDEARRKDAEKAAAAKERSNAWSRQVAIDVELARKRKAAVQEFMDEADQWDIATRRLAYVNHIAAEASAAGLLVDPDSPAAQWIAFARAACAKIDPTFNRIRLIAPKEPKSDEGELL